MATKVPIEKIKVPEERHRKEFKKIIELSNSIAEYGLIEPLIIDREYNLISGERRLRACKVADLKEVDCEFRENLDDWQRAIIELEENVQRENLTWQEEVDAKLKIHTLYQQRYGESRERASGGWTVSNTANLLGDSEGSTYMDIQLARAIKDDPTLAEIETKTGAYKALKAKEEIDVRKAIAKVLAEDAYVTQKEEPIRIILGDSREVLKTFEDESFDFCITDPPFAVGLDESPTFSKTWTREIYKDDWGDFSVHYHVLRETFRILKQGSHCYVFFAPSFFTEVKTMLVEIGFKVANIPLVWAKPKGGVTLAPFYNYASAYEQIFYCTKGTGRQFNIPGHSNVFIYDPPQNKVHPAERPLELIEWIMQNCSVENELGIDPFLGSGVFTLAAKKNNRRAVGVEMGEAYYVEALKKFEVCK